MPLWDVYTNVCFYNQKTVLPDLECAKWDKENDYTLFLAFMDACTRDIIWPSISTHSYQGKHLYSH